MKRVGVIVMLTVVVIAMVTAMVTAMATAITLLLPYPMLVTCKALLELDAKDRMAVAQADLTKAPFSGLRAKAIKVRA